MVDEKILEASAKWIDENAIASMSKLGKSAAPMLTAMILLGSSLYGLDQIIEKCESGELTKLLKEYRAFCKVNEIAEDGADLLALYMKDELGGNDGNN